MRDHRSPLFRRVASSVTVAVACVALNAGLAEAQLNGLGNLGRALNGRVEANDRRVQQVPPAPQRAIPAAPARPVDAASVGKRNAKRHPHVAPAATRDPEKHPAVYVE